ncbi:Uncharacterised protein [Vibrio cholerae]|uniref:Uncharacterized protein n=1 Tax=Vibrio cholerae TaxID=666 RepID=A0A655XKM2_VIBCL|nr:Uncharacterised protein [Vibrio cholerae]
MIPQIAVPKEQHFAFPDIKVSHFLAINQHRIHFSYLSINKVDADCNMRCKADNSEQKFSII